MAQMVKTPPARRETRVWSLGHEGSPEEGKATHSSILAWRNPWTEEPGRLQLKRSQNRKQLKQLSTHTRTALQTPQNCAQALLAIGEISPGTYRPQEPTGLWPRLPTVLASDTTWTPKSPGGPSLPKSSSPSSPLSTGLLHFCIVCCCAGLHMQTTKRSLNKACVSYRHLVVTSFPLLNPKISSTPSITHLSIRFTSQLQWVQCIIQNENATNVSWIIRSNDTKRNLFFKAGHSVFLASCVC